MIFTVIYTVGLLLIFHLPNSIGFGVHLHLDGLRRQDYGRTTKRFAIGNLGIANLANIIRKIKEDENYDKKDILLTTLTIFTPLWEAASELNSLLKDHSARPHIDKHSLARLIQRIDNIANHFHPEKFNNYIRDVFMARRLQITALYDKYKKQRAEKPRIAYRMHSGHGGVEDFLKLGGEITIRALDLCSDGVLEMLVRANSQEGTPLEKCIDTIATFPIFESGDDSGNGNTVLVMDSKIRDYLNERLIS